MSEAVKAAAEELEGECLLRSTAPPPVAVKPLLFYILMDASIIQEKKLMIPKKFVKKHIDKLSTLATLVLPSGDGRFIRLRQIDDNLWFTDGWHEFVVRYSICAGCLLVFKYEGDSIFKVSIFNLKSREADYTENPTSAGKEKQSSVSHGKESENVLDADNSQVKPRSTRDVGVQFDGTAVDVKQIYKPVVLKPTKTRNERNEPSNLVKETKMSSAKTSSTKSAANRVSKTPEKKGTIHLAEKSKPSIPQCRIVMRPSFVTHNKILHVPAKFAAKYLHGASEFVTLQDSDGKQWRARCLPNRHAAKLSKGWSKFVKDKHLEEGDVCVFELMEKEEKKKNVVLKVTITRVSLHSVTSETKLESEVQG